MLFEALGMVKQLQGAQKIGKLQKEIPAAQKSQYAQQMIGAAQTAANANPLMASMQRSTASQNANALYAARMGNPAALTQFAGALAGQGSQEALQRDIANQSLMDNRRQAYYGALGAGIQDERNYRNDLMENLQSKSNIISAKYNSQADAFFRMGKSINDAAATAMSAMAGGAGA